MTTNQTIDGVRREAFKWALEQLEEDGNKGCGYFDSLRALLDAPAKSDYLQSCEAAHLGILKQCKPAAQHQGVTPDDDKSHPRFIAGYTAGLHDHNLGQPQGEPVAYRYMDCNTGTCGPTKCGGIYYAEIPEYGRSWEVTTKSRGSVLIERKQHAIANGFVDSHPSLTVIIEPLYAERPAPVAVVLPERLTTAELEELEVIEAFIHGQGLSNLAGSMAAARQFIDEVTRLNTK